MKKDELKKVLKPLIKECIKEVLLEQGVSSLVSEASQSRPDPVRTMPDNSGEKAMKKRLDEQKKKMLDAIGKDAYNGVNLFEGTTPAPSTQGNGPLANVDPSDAGVDITKLPNFNVWKKLAGN